MNEPQVWIFTTEVCLLWGFAKRTVEYAIWRDNIKARQSVASRQWMVEYNSCVAYWGEPSNKQVIEEILHDVNY